MDPSFHGVSRLFVSPFENNTDRTTYRESWTLDAWFGRLDSGRLGAWTLNQWTLDDWTVEA